jgi:hypothetical protein
MASMGCGLRGAGEWDWLPCCEVGGAKAGEGGEGVTGSLQ